MVEKKKGIIQLQVSHFFFLFFLLPKSCSFYAMPVYSFRLLYLFYINIVAAVRLSYKTLNSVLSLEQYDSLSMQTNFSTYTLLLRKLAQIKRRLDSCKADSRRSYDLSSKC